MVQYRHKITIQFMIFKAFFGLLFGSLLGRLLSILLTVVLGYFLFMYIFNPGGLNRMVGGVKSHFVGGKKTEMTIPEINTKNIKKELNKLF